MDYFIDTDEVLLKEYYFSHLKYEELFNHLDHQLELVNPEDVRRGQPIQERSEIKLIFLMLCHFSQKTSVEDSSAFMEKEQKLYDLIYRSLFSTNFFYRQLATSNNSTEIPYDFIAFFIYRSRRKFNPDSVRESFDGLNDYLAEFTSKYPILVQRDPKIKENTLKIISKIKRHILLAIHQKSFMMDISTSARHLAVEAEATAKKADKIANETDGLVKGMYANYVAILGIFAAIIFAVFGSLNVLSQGLKIFEKDFDTDIVVLFVSITMLCTVTILHLLFEWIKSLQNPKDKIRTYEFVYIVLIVCIAVTFFSMLFR